MDDQSNPSTSILEPIHNQQCQNSDFQLNSTNQSGMMVHVVPYDDLRSKCSATGIHPFETSASFKKNPPIPIFNFVIDNRTFEIIEDNTGKP